jgi:PAS domain S-box-containing protein
MHYLAMEDEPEFFGQPGTRINEPRPSLGGVQLMFPADEAAVLEQLPVRVYVKDPQGLFAYANAACFTELGCRTASEVLGKSDIAFFRQELAEQWLQEERVLIKTGTSVLDRVEEERWLGGRVSWVLTSKIPLRNSQGNVVGVLGMSKDVTGIQYELHQYSLAARSAGDGLWYHDARTNRSWYSPRWKEMLGYSDDELANDAIRVRELVCIEDLPTVAAERARCTPAQPAFNYECRMRHRDGHLIWVWCRGMVEFDTDGNVIALAGSHTDITRSRSQEDYYRLLLDTVPSFIFVKDEHFRFTYVNRALAEALGRRRDTIRGTRDEDYFSDGQVQQFRRVDRLVLETGRPQQVEEETFTHLVYGQRILATIKVPLYADGVHKPPPDGIVGVATDITELRKTQDELQMLLNNVSEGVFFKDTEGRFTLVSRALAALVGAPSPEAMLGKTDADFFHPSVAAISMAEEREKVLCGTPLHNHVRGIALRNEPLEPIDRWRLVSKVPITGAGGEIVGLVGISQDVTAIMRTSEQLRAQTELQNDVFDAIPQKIFVKNLDGRYQLCNRAFAEGFGFSDPRDVVGKTESDLWGRELAEIWRQDELDVTSNDLPRVLRQYIPAGDGHGTRLLEKTLIPLHDAGRSVVGVVGICDDYTPAILLEKERIRTFQYLESLMRLEDDRRRLIFAFLLGLTHARGIGFNRVLCFKVDTTYLRLDGYLAIGQTSHDKACDVGCDKKALEGFDVDWCLSQYDREGGPPDRELNDLLQREHIDIKRDSPVLGLIQFAEQREHPASLLPTDQGGMGELGPLLANLEASSPVFAAVPLGRGDILFLSCDNVRDRSPPTQDMLRTLDAFSASAAGAMGQAVKRRMHRDREARRAHCASTVWGLVKRGRIR